MLGGILSQSLSCPRRGLQHNHGLFADSAPQKWKPWSSQGQTSHRWLVLEGGVLSTGPTTGSSGAAARHPAQVRAAAERVAKNAAERKIRHKEEAAAADKAAKKGRSRGRGRRRALGHVAADASAQGRARLPRMLHHMAPPMRSGTARAGISAEGSKAATSPSAMHEVVRAGLGRTLLQIRSSSKRRSHCHNVCRLNRTPGGTNLRTSFTGTAVTISGMAATSSCRRFFQRGACAQPRMI